MPRTKPTIEQDFKGKLSIKDFQAALEKIEETYQIPRERTIEILTQSIAKAVSDTLYPHLKITLKAKDGTLKEADSSKDVKISVQFDNDGNIRVYECKDVVEEVEDDLYQIEPDEAKEEDPQVTIAALKSQLEVLAKQALSDKEKMLVQNIVEFRR